MVAEHRFMWWVAGQTGSWIARHPVEAVAMTALLANPTTRTWAARVGWNVGKSLAIGTARTAATTAVITYEELVVGSRLAAAGGVAGTYAAAVGAGLVLGSVVGTGVAYLGWGAKGASDAVGLYSGQVSWSQYKRVVGGAFS